MPVLRAKRLWVSLRHQRGLGLLDLLVIAAVVALLVFAASREFALYQTPGATTPSQTAPATPPA
jgi:Tfp pilus assembly protein PilE